MPRRALVHRISASAPDDVSGIAAAIAARRIDPAGVIAVLAKTEGNGLVNDFSVPAVPYHHTLEDWFMISPARIVHAARKLAAY